MSGRFLEVQFVVFYVSGRLWEAQFVVLFTLRAVPPTRFTLIRVSFRGGICTEDLTPRAAFARLSAHCAYRRAESEAVVEAEP